MAAASGGKGAPPAATNPLLNPNAALTGNALAQAAQALANAQTQAPLTELARQIAQQQQQTQNAIKLTGGYFNQLGQQGQQAFQDQQGIGSGLNTTLSGIAGDENSRLEQVGQNAQTQMARYAPQGEGGLNAPAMQSLTTELARQQGLAAQNEGAYRAFGAQQGANASTLSASQLGVGALRGQEMLGDIGRAGQLKVEPMTNKVAALEAQKGALISTDEGKLRQQEINNQIARAGLGIRAETAATAANTAAFNANANAPGSPANQRAFDTNPNASGSPAQTRVFNMNPNAPGSPAQQRSFNTNPNAVGSPAYNRAYNTNPQAVGSPAWTRANKASSGALGSKANNQMTNLLGVALEAIPELQKVAKHGDIRAALVNGSVKQNGRPIGKIPSYLVEAAYELLGYGSVNQSTAGAMYGQGMRGTGWYNPKTGQLETIKVTKNYSPRNPSQQRGVGGAVTNAGNAIGNALGG